LKARIVAQRLQQGIDFDIANYARLFGLVASFKPIDSLLLVAKSAISKADSAPASGFMKIEGVFAIECLFYRNLTD
jgi:hypothetical protein